MKKLEKMEKILNEQFRDILDAEIYRLFGARTKTEYDFVLEKLVTHCLFDHSLTTDQVKWVKGFSEGYAAAMNLVRKQITSPGKAPARPSSLQPPPCPVRT